MLTLNGIVGIMAQPHILAAVGTGKDEHTCRVGFFHGMWAKRLCTVGWAFVGLIVAATVKRGVFGVHALKDPEDAFGFACQHLLSPGLRGLLIISVMGACLAACSALMVDSGALFAHGFYRPRLAPNQSDRHYLWVGRISGLAAVIVAVIYALFLIQRVLYSFLLTETLAAYMGISILGEIIWKRANRWGAASSIVIAVGTNFSLYHWKHQRLDYWDPNIFFAALAAGIAALVIVSLLTPAEEAARVAPFYNRLQTPSDPIPALTAAGVNASEDHEESKDWSENVQPGTSRWAAEHGRQLLLVNLLHPLRARCGVSFLQTYAEDLKGLLVGALLSSGLVFCLWVLLRL